MCSWLCYEGERSRCAESEVFWLREGADMHSILLIHRPRLKLLLTLDSADMLFPNCTLQYLPCLCAGDFREEEKYLNKYLPCLRAGDQAMPSCWQPFGMKSKLTRSSPRICAGTKPLPRLCAGTQSLSMPFLLEHFRNEANEHQWRHAFVLRQSRCHAFVLERSRHHVFVQGRNITINESML